MKCHNFDGRVRSNGWSPAQSERPEVPLAPRRATKTVVVVVEWLYYSKRITLARRADLCEFFVRRFSSENVYFCFTSNENCHFSSEKTITPQNGLLIFLGKETHSETKSWKSSRILRVNPNFFIFLSFFIIFLLFFSFFIFSFFSFFHFFHLFHFFHFSFFHFFIFHFPSFSFIFFHVRSCSFIF